MGHSLVAFIIVIGVLVFVHEFGHFLLARLCGVGVEVFSLGFGPKILRKQKGRTEYCISAIPLGGYVKMTGEDPTGEIAPEDKERSFTHKPLWRKALIVAAGPAFNFLLAIIIFYLLYQISGLQLAKPAVGKVLENTPAQAAGLKPGDVIREINGAPITSFGDISVEIARSGGAQVFLVVERRGEALDFKLTPQRQDAKNLFGETVDRYVIGVLGSGETFHQPLNLFQAMGRALSDTWGLIRLTITSVFKMVSGSISADNLGGPIMIAQMAGEQAKAGVTNFVWFIALLSVNLGIINLFPIPVLDGGHLLFFGIEAVTGRSVSDRLREKLIQFGAAMLVALMIFVFYNDIVRIFNGG
ncbi:MAG TPA: RIP metalloprotease RseP [Desulfobacteraceae bacterium]|nr:RIP metalloprotease RseP [Desulfobacteraceae bacterium]